MAFCCGDVLMGKRVIVWLVSWHVLHGESSHAESIRTTRNGFADDVAQASACKIVLRMSAGLLGTSLFSGN